MQTIPFITLTKENLPEEHICCAFSDKKCREGYQLKKEWLEKEFDNGYIFRRLNERAKVFIEYGPAENAWAPVYAPNYLMINCFWVSGQYKGKGYAKALLQSAVDDAIQQGKEGLLTIAGVKKFHFMSDTKWLQRQGFETIQTLPNGFILLAKKIRNQAANPTFNSSVLSGECPDKNGIVVYYTNRCPFTKYYVEEVLTATVKKRGLPIQIIQLTTKEEAQSSPTPATIFSLSHNGKFITTDMSICLESKFNKLIQP
ncbi:MAG: GNAT family N-acetyltransferase [Tannerellaceae bacterium]|nr:GNAT family N-acetyltransferase [Tannerellaceae bacterium]